MIFKAARPRVLPQVFPATTVPFLYALIGLPPAERALIESVFQLDTQDADLLVQTQETARAQLLIVNSDDDASVRALRERHRAALLLLVGRRVPGVDAPAIGRPLTVSAVMRVLGALPWTDELAASMDASARHLGNPSSLSLDSMPSTMSQADSSAFAPTTLSAPLHPTHPPVVARPPDSTPRAASQVTAPDVGAVADEADAPTDQLESTQLMPGMQPTVAADLDAPILVVARVGTRTLTLPRGLRRLGYRVQVVDGADAALARMAERPAQVVFLDHASLRDELLPLARVLAAGRETEDGAPHVAVVSRGGSPLERFRAHAAGCVWMKVPVERERLLAFLGKRGLRPDADPG